MADQSAIQSLLQSGTGLQSLAQQNAPTGPNTGNPNTVYNLASPNVRQFNPATGALPPMGDIYGNWAVPAQQAQQQTGPSPELLALLQTGVQQQNVRPVIPTGPMPTIPPINIPSLPGPPPPATPPTGGPVAPPMGGPQPAIPAATVNPGTRPDASVGAGLTAQGLPRGGYTQQSVGGPGYNGVPVTGTNMYGPQGGNGGTMSWQELLDRVSEPFLPGNLYLSGSGKWDLSNAAMALAGRMGLPVNQVLSMMDQSPAQLGLDYLTQMTGLPVSQAAQLFNMGQNGPTLWDQLMQMDPNAAGGSMKWLQDYYMDNFQNRLDVLQRDNLSSTSAKDANRRDTAITDATLKSMGLDGEAIRAEQQAAMRAAEMERFINGRYGPDVAGALNAGASVSDINRGYNGSGTLISPQSRALINSGGMVISNGAWRNADGSLNMSAGDAAAGFGIGSGAAFSPSSYAISDAIKANAKNKV